MQLLDLLNRAIPPAPWAEGDNIPWHEPGFSARMLAEHLSQAHDAASRRSATIDRQVAWIHTTLLGTRPARILDLGCGPGLYTSRLARLGHQCVGIDYSPASLAHARAEATAEGLACTYHQADLRTASFGQGFDLGMLIFGELNVFAPDQAAALLRKAHAALTPGGALVLEVHTLAAVQALGTQPAIWEVAAAGLFAPTPYLLLNEAFWAADQRIATLRYYIVDLADGALTRYAQSMQGYSEDSYVTLLGEAGFTDLTWHAALTGAPEPEQADMRVIVARAG
ncbi:MAG: class I SAM-dependent methyltransferase [Oscillochloridaceae bacterium umkhey_bin13]